MSAEFLPLFQVLIGLPLLTFGRKLFWFFVGVMGFLTGLQLSNRFWPAGEGWGPIIFSLVLGLIGIILAIVFQKFAVWIIGFLAGCYLAFQIIQMITIPVGDWTWLIVIIGGIIGAGLTIGLFEWALIFLSSLGGAIIILQGLHQILPIVNTTISLLLFLILIITGLFFQAKQKQDE